MTLFDSFEEFKHTLEYAHPDNWEIMMVSYGLKTNQNCIRYSSQGSVNSNFYEEFTEFLTTTFKAKLLLSGKTRAEELAAMWDNGAAWVYWESKTERLIRFLLFNNDELEVIKKFLKTRVSKSTKNNYYIISHDGSEYTYKNLGSIPNYKFERDNYSTEVTADLDHILEDFNKKEPCGRIVIFHGPPGTGKTNLVQGLVSLSKANRFVIVPNTMIRDLSSPSISRLLIEEEINKNKDFSTILLFEDADEALVPRGTDNISAITNLLNLGDGIIGKLMNIRILATTNALDIKIDSAIKRAGRLCRLVNVNTLSYEQACKVYSRLVGEETEYPKNLGRTLAEIYACARNEKPTVNEGSRKVGF